MQGLGHPTLVAVFVGATFTATSVGITARVLADMGRLQDPAANVVLGAAVVDDILGLIMLAVVTGAAQTGSVSPRSRWPCSRPKRWSSWSWRSCSGSGWPRRSSAGSGAFGRAAR
jgi:hypothetical protein